VSRSTSCCAIRGEGAVGRTALRRLTDLLVGCRREIVHIV
jgi:hypothetical protein